MIDMFEIKTGDIIEFIKPTISKVDKRYFKNSDSNQHLSTTAFKVEGIQEYLPFANGIVKKRFVAWTNTNNPNLGGNGSPRFSLALYLLDNYKPGILGSGYQIQLKYNTACFKQLKVTGRILNLKKLPIKVRIAFYRNQVHTEHIKNKLNKTNYNTEDKIAFLRKNFLMLPGLPPPLQVAFLSVASDACRRCGQRLLNDHIKLINMENVIDKESIAKSISNKLISGRSVGNDCSIYVSPIAYQCHQCGHANFLVKISNNRKNKRSVFADSEFPMEPKSLIICANLNSSQRKSMDSEIITW